MGAWLAAHKTYPDEARRRGEEGRLVIRFTTDQAGRVSAVEVVSSSGSSALDESARNLLLHAALPPFPSTETRTSLTVTLQIHYALSE